MNNQVNPMFAKFDQVLGKTTPTTLNAPVSTRADEIRNLAKQAQTPPPDPYADRNIIKNYATDAGKRAIGDIKQAGSNVHDAITGEGDYAGQSSIRRGVEATGEAFATPLKVASEALPEIARKGLGKVGESAGGVVNWLGEKLGSTEAAQNFVTKHPDAAKTLEETVGTLSAGGGIAGDILTVGAGEKALDKGVEKMTPKPGESVPVNMNEPAPVESSATTQAKTSSDLQDIKEKISPKPTVKEAKLALDQGRLIKGKDPTLFKSGTPDKIATSDQQLKSTLTINKLIPDAAKMDEPTLYQALDDKISETAKSLEPVMKKTPIGEETVSNITKNWEELKKTQIENADATDEPNVLKSQKQFEARLQKSSSGNMNDLWNTAKEYDASVPDNVKQANQLSSESLQNKKEIWLQNRSIIRSALTDSENGLGESAKKPFSDMRDMYEAQNGIMSKAKLETKVQPSKLKQAYNSKTGKVIRTAAKVGVGLDLLKHGL